MTMWQHVPSQPLEAYPRTTPDILALLQGLRDDGWELARFFAKTGAEFADRVEELRAEGWELVAPIDEQRGDYWFKRRFSAELYAERRGRVLVEPPASEAAT